MKITGTLQNGALQGIGKIFYRDRTHIQARFYSGTINGKVRIYDKYKKLRAIGLFKDGIPHGPYLVIKNTNEVAQFNLQNGKISR